jgi:hypothetical protein
MEKAVKQFDAALAMNASLRSELEQNTRDGADMHASQKTMLAVYRPDLSYRPHRMDAVAKSRYFGVGTSRINMGHSPDYEAWIKELNAAREKVNADWVHTAVFQVVTGAPMGTYMTFTMNQSLGEFDEFRAKLEERNKAIDAALGEAVVKDRRKQAAEIFADTDNAMYALTPSISRPSPTFMAYDPGFWTPRTSAAEVKALASKKEKPAPKP